MTTKSHQPEFVAEIIGKTLDHLIDDRKRVAVSFELAENGCMEETHVSLNVYSSVQFSVNGKGWSTDFKTIARDTAYDEKE